jgi:hypothetical protein
MGMGERNLGKRAASKTYQKGIIVEGRVASTFIEDDARHQV